MAILLRRLLVLFLTFPLTDALAKQDVQGFSEIYALYEKGAYSQAVEKLDALRPDSEQVSLKHYWTGLCQSRLQNFEAAVGSFRLALDAAGPYEDLAYEFGQSLYALNRLQEARQAFKYSARKGYKSGASLYYLAFISELLEETTLATKAYEYLAKSTIDTENVRQAASFQLAELKLGAFLLKNNIESLPLSPQTKRTNPALAKNISLALKSEVIPNFRRVASLDATTPLALQANKRIEELDASNEAVDPRVYVSGEPIPSKLYLLKPGFEAKWDSNVINFNDPANFTPSGASSAMLQANLNANLIFISDRSYVLQPTFDFLYGHYLSNEEVIVVNNNLSATLAARQRVEYKMGTFSSATHFDLEYNHYLRYLAGSGKDARLGYFSSYLNASLGQRTKFFSFGQTSLTLHFKRFLHSNPDFNAWVPAAFLTQSFDLGSKHRYSLTLNGDYNFSQNEGFSRIDYGLANNLTFSSILLGFDLTTGITLSFVENSVGWDRTAAARITPGKRRGLEPLLNLTLGANRIFPIGLQVGANATYLHNTSSNAAFSYRRFIIGAQTSYMF